MVRRRLLRRLECALHRLAALENADAAPAAPPAVTGDANSNATSTDDGFSVPRTLSNDRAAQLILISRTLKPPVCVWSGLDCQLL